MHMIHAPVIRCMSRCHSVSPKQGSVTECGLIYPLERPVFLRFVRPLLHTSGTSCSALHVAVHNYLSDSLLLYVFFLYRINIKNNNNTQTVFEQIYASQLHLDLDCPSSSCSLGLFLHLRAFRLCLILKLLFFFSSPLGLFLHKKAADDDCAQHRDSNGAFYGGADGPNLLWYSG